MYGAGIWLGVADFDAVRLWCEFGRDRGDAIPLLLKCERRDVADLEMIIEPRAAGVRWRCVFGCGWGSVRGVGYSRTRWGEFDENINITYCFIPLCSETHIVGVILRSSMVAAILVSVVSPRL